MTAPATRKAEDLTPPSLVRKYPREKEIELLPPLDWRQRRTYKNIVDALGDGKDPSEEDWGRFYLASLARLMMSRRPEDVRHAFSKLGLKLPNNAMTKVVADQRRARERVEQDASEPLAMPKS